jgi:hypothetical protein
MVVLGRVPVPNNWNDQVFGLGVTVKLRMGRPHLILNEVVFSQRLQVESLALVQMGLCTLGVQVDVQDFVVKFDYTNRDLDHLLVGLEIVVILAIFVISVLLNRVKERGGIPFETVIEILRARSLETPLIVLRMRVLLPSHLDLGELVHLLWDTVVALQLLGQLRGCPLRLDVILWLREPF